MVSDLSERTRDDLEQLREHVTLYVPAGFQDEDGVWHDGPHRARFLASLDRVAARVASLEEELAESERNLNLVRGGYEVALSDVASLEAERDKLREAILMCIGDAEGQEAVRDRKMLELTKGQVQFLAASVAVTPTRPDDPSAADVDGATTPAGPESRSESVGERQGRQSSGSVGGRSYFTHDECGASWSLEGNVPLAQCPNCERVTSVPRQPFTRPAGSSE